MAWDAVTGSVVPTAVSFEGWLEALPLESPYAPPFESPVPPPPPPLLYCLSFFSFFLLSCLNGTCRHVAFRVMSCHLRLDCCEARSRSGRPSCTDWGYRRPRTYQRRQPPGNQLLYPAVSGGRV